MKIISRDPFARTELHRERVYTRDCACDWCGQTPKTQTGREYLYMYYVVSDSGRASRVPSRVPRGFCSVDCMRSYHA